MAKSSSYKELIASDSRLEQAWAYEGERWVLVLQDDENTPTFHFAVKTEAECVRICRLCQDAHIADNSKFIVSYYMPALPIAKVKLWHQYGMNGRVGRSKTMASLKRTYRETLIAEGHVLPDRVSIQTLASMRQDIFAEIDMWDRVEALMNPATDLAANLASQYLTTELQP